MNVYISCCTMPVQVLVVDFLRSPVAECRMETRPIIAELDIARIVLTRFPDRRIYSTVDPLDFHCRVERSTGSTRCGPRTPDIETLAWLPVAGSFAICACSQGPSFPSLGENYLR